MNRTNVILLGIAACFSMLTTGCRENPEDKEQAYLFAYFTGNGAEGNHEALRFAVSLDGYHYYALNENEPVLDSKEISSTGGIRDPHIYRGPDGKTFYMVMTDMVAANGWDSNRAMVLLKSTDLINWQHNVVNIQERFAGNDSLKRVWAPQAIYDPKADKMLIYWSMKHGINGKDKIYYSYANNDFTDLATEPKPFFEPKDGEACIDGDIAIKDGVYHLFYKTEGHGNGIKTATSTDLTSGNWTEYPDYKQQTDKAVEGAGTFKMIDSDKYILMYDVYRDKRYQFTESTDLVNFKAIDDEITMDFHPRHGTIIAITGKELQRLYDKWGVPAPLSEDAKNPVIPGFYSDPEITYSHQTDKYYIYASNNGESADDFARISAFSSRDLKTWQSEGVVLDVAGPQVGWSDGIAWGPSVLETATPGEYEYYLFFSANDTTTNHKVIGVAKSTSPTGPYIAIDKPIITESPVDSGYQIDVAVYDDILSDKTYIYWGNRYLAVAELDSDKTSLKPGTIKVITPEGGTDSTYAYNGAPYVLYRNGTYYFMWSVGNVRSHDYHVVYGTSASPLGPIRVADEPIIVKADPEQSIYGVGHNSVVQIPGTNDWYIAYHRFNLNFLDSIDKPALHREICIDSIMFESDGRILPIKPTL